MDWGDYLRDEAAKRIVRLSYARRPREHPG
jgi:hypothetical protein